MTLEDLKTFDVRQGHKAYQCKIDIFGLRHLWHKWRDRRQIEQNQIEQGIEEDRQAESDLAEWLKKGDV